MCSIDTGLPFTDKTLGPVHVSLHEVSDLYPSDAGAVADDFSMSMVMD